MTAPTRPLRHLVGGEWIDGDGAEQTSIDPADPAGAPVATYRAASESQIDAAIAAADAAREEWDALGMLGRGRVLRRAAELVEERSEELAALMTAEHGKTLNDSRLELGGTVETLYYHAAAARRPDGASYPATHPDEVVRTVRRPVGAVAVITPWNFPIQIPAWKIAPALLWGNTIVWKPASDTPAMAVAFAELLVEAGVPAGVLNLVLAPGALAARIVADERVDAVTFTGSVPVGRSIRDVAVPRGARLQMELGGHNPALVFPDADLEAAADGIVAAATNSTGQKCTATRRIIAVGEAYEPLREALARRFEALRVGPGTDGSTTLGPLVNARAAEEVAAAVRTAVEQGATVVATAPVPEGAGHWSAPTLLEGDGRLDIAREEVFGPVPLLMRAADADEAIRIANDTEFGLTASVFTSDERIARRCVDRITAGLIKVNAPSTGSEVHAPFGGLASSSFPAPREQASDAAAEFFSITKAAYFRLPPTVTGV